MQAAHESYADNPSSSTSHKHKKKQHEDMKGAQFTIQSNIKIMARSIAALSKISEDMYIEVSENGLFFKVFHRSKYCVFRFAPEFFNSCDLSMINRRAANICRLSMKSALRIFKGVTFGDKNIVGCEFRIDPKAEKMSVNLQMNYDINRMIHAKLRETSSCLQKTAYDRLLCRNKTVVFASTLIPILAQMKADIEVTIKVDGEGITIRNFHSADGATTFNASEQKSAKKVRTETTVHLDKLTRHEVAIPVEISFSLKEFLAITTFADQLGSEVCLYYDLPSKPMILSIEAHANFDIELALATTGNDDEVDLDGGIIQEVLMEDSTESSQTSNKNRKKKSSAPEDIDITCSSSSKSKRRPRNIEEAPKPIKKSSQPSRNHHVSPCITPIPVVEKSWRDNDVEMVEQPANEPDFEVTHFVHEEVPEEMQVGQVEERNEVPDGTIAAMQDVSIHAALINSPIRAAPNGTDEVVDMTPEKMEMREQEENDYQLFQSREAKRRKTSSEYRNKKMRRILMGMTPAVATRMSQKFSGAPLVMDTQR